MFGLVERIVMGTMKYNPHDVNLFKVLVTLQRHFPISQLKEGGTSLEGNISRHSLFEPAVCATASFESRQKVRAKSWASAWSCSQYTQLFSRSTCLHISLQRSAPLFLDSETARKLTKQAIIMYSVLVCCPQVFLVILSYLSRGGAGKVAHNLAPELLEGILGFGFQTNWLICLELDTAG